MSREDIIHVHIREYLKEQGYNLVAGQFPNGSDDELTTLTIRVLGDTPRKFHLDSFVPDLVAINVKLRQILIVEIKPSYSLGDEEKLSILFRDYKEHIFRSLSDHPYFKKQNTALLSNLRKMQLVPVISFFEKKAKNFDMKDKFLYLLFSQNRSLFTVKHIGNSYGFADS